MGGATAEFRGEPLRSPARERPDRPRRAGRGIGIAAAALVEGKDRRRPGGAARGRTWHRLIKTYGRATGTAGGRVAHAAALFLLVTAHRHCAFSDHRPDA